MDASSLRLGAALLAGAADAHLSALLSVRDTGCMWPHHWRTETAERARVTRDLWSWNAVRRGRAALYLTPIGSAILFAAAQRGRK
jgi:hypothetical protein